MNPIDCYAPAGTAGARPLHLVSKDALGAWREVQPETVIAWLDAHGFDASAGSCVVIPGADGTPAAAVLGIGDTLDPCAYAHAPRALPAGDWAPAGDLDAAVDAVLARSRDPEALARVGGTAGPDLRRLRGVRAQAPGRRVYAAGGVRGAKDLAELRAVGCAGVLLASALHDGRLGSGELARIAR